MIAGTGSGSGKTTIVCGLCQCFKDMGLNISALKCGPDYIDSMFHSRVLNMSTGNLDSWFCDNATIKYLLAGKEDKSDITIVEGVMGYYDGQGFSTKGSSYEIADITDTPVILIVNCRGMSNSIGAVVKGYLGYEKNNNIKGVIFNNLSDRLYGNAARIVKDMGIEPLGYMPYKKNAVLESRHLGLVTSAEVEHFQEKISSIAEQMRESVDIEGILRIAENASKLEAIHKSIDKKDVRIAVAKDEAFCFLYDDNIDYLRQCGCEIVYFSPLAHIAGCRLSVTETFRQSFPGFMRRTGYFPDYPRSFGSGTDLAGKCFRSHGRRCRRPYGSVHVTGSCQTFVCTYHRSGLPVSRTDLWRLPVSGETPGSETPACHQDDFKESSQEL